MSVESIIIAYVITTIVALVVLYVLIRLGVKHGTAAALQAHEVWMRDGSLERALDAHAAKLAAESDSELRNRAQMRQERGNA